MSRTATPGRPRKLSAAFMLGLGLLCGLALSGGCLDLSPDGKRFACPGCAAEDGGADAGTPACGCTAPEARCTGGVRTVSSNARCLEDGGCAFDVQTFGCDGGCAGALCATELCLGTTCTDAPASTCLDGTTRQTFTSPGTCAPATGKCNYPPQTQRCPGIQTCSDGRCVGAPPAATWRLLSPATKPAGRSSSFMAFDAARQRVLLFSGQLQSGFANDTWEWDGTTWLSRTTTTAPLERRSHAMAYDAARQRLVLFGGSENAPLNDTWEWDGSNWVQRTPGTKPAARYGQGMAYDTARQRVVLFGGRNADTYFDDTWEWDGATWKQIATSTSPPARSAGAMSYDSARQRVVLFGGFVTPDMVNDTWEYDGVTWLKRNPASSPAPRADVRMVDDVERGRVVLFGGDDFDKSYDDTWEWDGTNWTLTAQTTQPSARNRFALAYDSARKQVVLFGGLGGGVLSDTWVYAP